MDKYRTKNRFTPFFLELKRKGLSYNQIALQAVRQFPEEKEAHLSPQRIHMIVRKNTEITEEGNV